jgi:hypothetical protein
MPRNGMAIPSASQRGRDAELNMHTSYHEALSVPLQMPTRNRHLPSHAATAMPNPRPELRRQASIILTPTPVPSRLTASP